MGHYDVRDEMKLQIANHKKKLESYEKAIKIDPNNAQTWFNIGYTYDQLRNRKKAIESFKKGLTIDSKNANAWYNMGMVYKQDRNIEKAKESFEKVIELNPNDSIIWQQMGIFYDLIENNEKAIECYEKALLINPKDDLSWYNLGFSYGESGDHIKEIESFKEAAKINKKTEMPWYQLGFAYSRNSNFEKAIESFKKALEIKPNRTEIQRNIGEIYRKLGNYKKAKELIEKTYFKDKFRFIRDDVFLCAQVDIGTGEQKLIIQKIDLETDEVEFETSIDCIHTAVTNISTEEFEDYQNDTDAQENINKKILEIRSSEDLEEINLTPEENFKAFKSWAAGIAEAGVNAFFIQDEIDKNLDSDLLLPISQFLLRFMVKVDREFLPEFISKIERECMFEGVRHESSFIANTIPILEVVWENYSRYKMIKSEDIEIVKTLAELDNSGKLFKINPNFLILLRLSKEENNGKFVLQTQKEII